MNISMSGIEFEKHHPLVQIVRVPLLQSLRVMPYPVAHKLLIKWSSDARDACRWARTHKALEMMYTFPERRKRGDTSSGDVFWQTFLSNARAIRNRLKLVEHLLKNLIIERSEKAKPPRLLSLGSGSGRSVFEAIASLDGKVPVKAALLDSSRSAIKFSRGLSEAILGDGAMNSLQWVCTRTEDVGSCLVDFFPDIVEMVGLLDYFEESKAKDLFRLIHKNLSTGGWFVVSNVIPNLERRFVDKVVGWPLIYREPPELKKLVIESGFNEEGVSLFVEPLRIYAIAVCQKR
ncbi:MAG: hypothetical protein CEE38_21970 [Planctomycetes bacterium B3_Pla]|nr:MAG: hypothetical protein CEE38_21970 [Planctomycetes bacterium B3_Pla]